MRAADRIEHVSWWILAPVCVKKRRRFLCVFYGMSGANRRFYGVVNGMID
jgi:hypothetical protein